MGSLSVIEAKGCRVFHKEVNEAVDDYVAWTSGWVVDFTFHDKVFVSLNCGFSTRAVIH